MAGIFQKEAKAAIRGPIRPVTAPDQTRSLPAAELNVWLRQKPPFRFRDRATTAPMTTGGWKNEWRLFGKVRAPAAEPVLGSRRIH